MKNSLIILTIAGLSFGSCKKAEELKYSYPDSNIYLNFSDNTTQRDSVVYTFAYTPGLAKDTVFIPIRISGMRKSYDRTFKVAVNEALSTAKPGTHYEALKDAYTLPADSGKAWLPIIVYNTDPTLADRSVMLSFGLVASEDFMVDLSDMTTGRVVISNNLEKPYWWGPGQDTWGIPNYSKVKHELWLIATGIIDLPFNGLNAPQYLYYLGQLTSLLNNPQAWVDSHPESGYVLVDRPDGNYDFYNTSIPAKKLLYKKNSQSGKYYFIDENGIEVI